MAIGKKNFLGEAAGSLKEARRLMIEHLQQPEAKITSANADDVAEMLALGRKIEDLRADVEVMVRRTNGG